VIDLTNPKISFILLSSDKLDDMYRNYSKYVDRGKRQGYKSRTEFNIDKMSERLKGILDKNMPQLSVNVPISLPKIKKLELPKLKTEQND
jgi:hypothetical protein